MSLKYLNEPKKDCFAFNHLKGGCNALSELVCAYKDKCAFYKRRDEVDTREIERAIKSYSGPK